MRDPEWRRKHPTTGLRLHPDDAATLDVEHGAQIRIITKAGEAISNVEISDSMLPGMVSLPNGQGLSWPGADADTDLGVYLNELTSVDDRDWFAGTRTTSTCGPGGEGVRRTRFDADPCPIARVADLFGDW